MPATGRIGPAVRRAEQRGQVGVEFGVADPLAAPAEHRERHDRQAQKFLFYSVLELPVRQVGAGFADLTPGEAGQ